MRFSDSLSDMFILQEYAICSYYWLIEQRLLASYKYASIVNKRNPDRSGVFHQVRVSCHSSGDDVFCEENKVICL